MCGWVWPDVGTVFTWCSPSGPLCSQGGHYVEAGVSCSNLQPHVPLLCRVCSDQGGQSRPAVFWLQTVGSHGVLDTPFSLWDLFSSSVSTGWSFGVLGVPDSDTILQVLSAPAPWGNFSLHQKPSWFLPSLEEKWEVGLVSLLCGNFVSISFCVLLSQLEQNAGQEDSTQFRGSKLQIELF